MVEIGGVFYEFFVGDDFYFETKEIYLMVEEIMNRMRIEGYFINTNEVLFDLDEEVKEIFLFFYSEKLVVVYVLLKISVGILVWVVKNFRVCGDCYEVMKIILRVYNWEIIV